MDIILIFIIFFVSVLFVVGCFVFIGRVFKIKINDELIYSFCERFL